MSTFVRASGPGTSTASAIERGSGRNASLSLVFTPVAEPNALAMATNGESHKLKVDAEGITTVSKKERHYVTASFGIWHCVTTSHAFLPQEHLEN